MISGRKTKIKHEKKRGQMKVQDKKVAVGCKRRMNRRIMEDYGKRVVG